MNIQHISVSNIARYTGPVGGEIEATVSWDVVVDGREVAHVSTQIQLIDVDDLAFAELEERAIHLATTYAAAAAANDQAQLPLAFRERFAQAVQ